MTLSKTDLKNIDQLANVLNIDYELSSFYQWDVPCSKVFGCVNFNFKKPYDLKKAITQQKLFDNKRLLNFNVLNIIFFILDVFAITALIASFNNLISKLISISTVAIVAVGMLTVDYQIKKMYQQIIHKQ